MNTSDQYYCVGCGKMERLDLAQQLFRTGFFRVIYPLGCCVKCSEETPEESRPSDPLLDREMLKDSNGSFDDKCAVYRDELQVNQTLDDLLVRV
ncbi:hypothetical protein AB6A23_02880 [Paenibacillus tarimensis]